jgi:precorrin-6B methylase 1
LITTGHDEATIAVSGAEDPGARGAVAAEGDRKYYGPGSEKLSVAQPEPLELEAGVSSVEVQAESEREPLAART